MKTNYIAATLLLVCLFTPKLSFSQTTFCVGDVVTLSITRSNGCAFPGYDVVWSGPSGSNTIDGPQDQFSSSYTVRWQTPGTYRLMRPFHSSCTGTPIYSPYYTVVARPNAPSAGEVSQQAGCGQATLTYTGSAYDTYWQTCASCTDETYRATRTVTSSGTYYARVKGGGGCWSAAQSIIVNIAALPVGGTLTGGNTGSYFGTISKLLTLSGINGTVKEYRYRENGGPEIVVPNTTTSLTVSFSSSASVSRVYWAVVTKNGCDANSTSTTVSLTSLPAATMTACVGETKSYTITKSINCSSTSDVVFALGYGGTINSPNQEGFTVTWTTPGTYTLKRPFPNCDTELAPQTTVQVLPQPTAPSAVEVNQQVGCGQVTLNYTGSAYDTYWQTCASCTDETYRTTRIVTASQTYHARTKNSNGCWSGAQPITVNIPALPVGGTLSGGTTGSHFGTVSRPLTLSGITGTVKEYRYKENGGPEMVVNNTTTSLTVSFSSSASVSRVYWAVVQNNGCEANSTTTTVSLSALPAATMTACVGETKSYNITKSMSCSSTSNVEFALSSGGTINNPDQSDFTVTWTTPGTYTLKRPFPNCDTELAPGTTIQVYDIPHVPLVAEVTQQPGTCGQVVLNFTGIGTAYWQNTSLGTDETFSTTRTVTATGNYYARIKNVSGCWGGARILTVTSLPSSPAGGTLSGGGTWIGSVSSNLNLSGQSGSIKEYRYTENGGSAVIVAGTTSPLAVSISNPTSSAVTRQYWAIVQLNGCEVSSSTATVTINPVPTPTASILQDNSACGSTIVTQNNPLLPTEQYEWWWQTTLSGTSTALGSSSSVTVTSSGPLYLRARSKNSPLTWGPASQSLGTIPVSSMPSAPNSGTNASGFYNNSITLSVGSVPTATGYRWYDSQSGGTLKATTVTNSHTIPNLVSTTPLFVAAVSGGCETSDRFPVTATLVSPQIVLQSQSPNVILGAPVILGVNGVYDSYTWKDNAGTIKGTQSTYSTTQPDKYTITVTKSGIAGSGVSPEFKVEEGPNGQNRNFIVANSVLVEGVTDGSSVDALNVESNSQVIQYFDGLGRPVQSVTTQGSPNKKDIVQPIVYDNFGREQRKYLPVVPGSSDGWYKTITFDESGNYAGLAGNFYSNNSTGKVAQDIRPFSEIVFEPSPLSRVVEQGAPGLAWQPDGINSYTSNIDRTIKRSYEFNTANEVLFWTYTPPANGNLFGKVSARMASAPVYYAANQLYKNKTKDEERHEVIEYSNKEGKLILKKVQADENGTWSQTYYIYDDLGNQVCVIPPEGTLGALQSLQDAVVNFTANSTWICPEGVTSIAVECWGGGGVGGAVGGNPAAAGGGAGGAYARKVIAVTPGITYTVTVGAAKGNVGKLATAVQNTGNPSWFGNTSLVFAQGGPGAVGGQDNNNFNGAGALGSSSLSIGDVVFAGGNGADGAYTLGLAGGAGGGAGSLSSIGGNAVGGTGGIGANGNPNNGNGANGPANSTHGLAGATYGGGGAGGKANTSTDRNGGGGAAGYVRISYDVTPVAVNNWVFRSTYDNRKRKTINQVPGAQPLYFIYDNHDRVVLTQDGNQRANNRWTFTKYDALNRPVLTGIYTSAPNIDQDSMQVIVNAYYANLSTNNGAWYETFMGNTAGIHGYDNKSFPQVNNQNDYLTVTYYDNYNFKTLLSDSARYSFKSDELEGQKTSNFKRITGQVTGLKAKVLNGGVTGYTWLTSVSYFDNRNRVLQVINDNYKNGKDRTTNVYDFVGKLLKTKTTHTVNDLHWIGLTGIQFLGDKFTRTAASSTWNTSGAASSETLAAATDGWFEFVPVATTKILAAGFSTANTDNNWTTIKYCFYINSNATFQVRENGSTTNLLGSAPAYSAGDVFRIERKQGKINYYKNGVLLLQRDAVSNALLSDVAIYTTAGELAGLRSSFGLLSEKKITRRLTYDHAGRQLRTYHAVNDDEVLLSENTYNELGQLITKKLHSADNGNNFNQYVDYRYNIRGWLTRINDSALTPDDVNEPKDLFGMNLAYNDVLPSINNTPMFNGNISATKWSTNSGFGIAVLDQPTERAYTFSYDPMNRLLAASHQEKNTVWSVSSSFHEGNLTYDLNGNIKTLNRNGDDGTNMDQLTYDYGTGINASNKLLAVTDVGDITQGFKEAGATAADYVYDSNGNMVWDRNKGGMELLTNGNFDSGSTNWTITDTGSRLTFADSAVQIIASTVSAVLTQNVLVKSKPYVVVVDIERTAGTLTVYLGGTSINLTSTGQHVLSVTSGSTNAEFRLTAGTTFVGNIKSVSVKGVTVIAYNHLNLPELVTKAGDQQLVFIYDASGRKVAQELSKNGVIEKRTDYNGEFIYENDTLQFVNQEEGRIVMKDGTPEYQYHLKDHLGNVRLTFTTKPDVEAATATLETANVVTEQSQFSYYDEAVKINSTLFDHTNNGATNYSTRLTGGNTNEIYGLVKTLSVMPGDTLNIEVFAKYLDPTSTNWNAALQAFIASIQPGGGAPAGTFIDGGVAGSIGSQTFPYIGELSRANDNGTGPKGYLNYLLFDRNWVPITGGFQRISSTPRETGSDVAHERLAFDNLVITEPGYIYIYLSNENETPVEVYFDDFKVEHIKSPVIQTDDYYPFGLTFNSYSRENSVANNFLYNGFEKQDELDLGWYDYLTRQYDPTVGRFTSIDPAADLMRRVSPYVYAFNNPIRFIDPDGMIPEDQVQDKERVRSTSQNTKVTSITPNTNEDGEVTSLTVNFTLTNSRTVETVDDDGQVTGVREESVTSNESATFSLYENGGTTDKAGDITMGASLNNINVPGGNEGTLNVKTTTKDSETGESSREVTTQTTTNKSKLTANSVKSITDARSEFVKENMPSLTEKYFNFILSKPEERNNKLNATSSGSSRERSESRARQYREYRKQKLDSLKKLQGN